MNDLTTSKIKSFWERPEGFAGMAAIGIGCLAVYFIGLAILPSINLWLALAIGAVGKTIVLAGVCAVAALLLAIGLNERFQLFVSFMFKSAMRKLAGVDPIGVMKGYIETLIEKKSKFDKNKGELRGQIRGCDQQINANRAEISRATQLAQAAKAAGNQGQLTVHGRNMSRLEELNNRMQSTRDKMQMLYDFLGKYSEATDLVIQDMTNDVRAREQERKYSTTANSAMRSAMGILRGEGVGKSMYDDAMEYALEDYANKMGEIDDFMDSTQSIMDGIDLQNGVWQQSAIDKLSQFESKTTSLLLGGEKRLMLESSNASTIEMSTTPLAANTDYNKLFSK
jgi:hypothetical protein